jgi:hypothetical protein
MVMSAKAKVRVVHMSSAYKLLSDALYIVLCPQLPVLSLLCLTCSSVDTPGSQLGPAQVPSRLRHTCTHPGNQLGSVTDDSRWGQTGELT